MIILEHSLYAEKTIANSLGLPEYSYWFVRKAFAPLLERFGAVVPLASPVEDADRIFRSAKAHAQDCVFLSFSAPHQTPTGLTCPTVPVFAWEYDTIPNEAWDDEPQNDWRQVLRRTPAAITHSRFSVHAVRRALGSDYPIWSIPAPVADRQAGLETTAVGWRERIELDISNALVFDSWAIDLSLFADDLGVRSAKAIESLQRAMREGGRQSRRIELGGVVYTSVLNPIDGRKNWADMATAFTYAFREEPRATLILKTTHRDLHKAVTPMLQYLAKLGRFRCRILVVHGMLNDSEYQRLIEASSYAVNTSHGEGQCLPLMEFMAAGRPAITPRHTAMLDYVSQDNAFVVADHHRPASWPHDMRHVCRCLRHQIEFADLVRRYRQSFAVARDQPQQYAEMSKASVEALRAFCGDEVVAGRLGEMFAYVCKEEHPRLALAPERVGSTGRSPNAALPPAPSMEDHGFLVGLTDDMLTGWYNRDTGELTPGFPISGQDIVVDVGCGDGGPAQFCARTGAHVILADVDGPRLERAAERLREEGASRVDAYVTDADPLPLPDGQATRVVCMEVMEHVEDPAVLMRELVRVGAPGALYLITVPGHVHEQMQKHLAPPEYFERPNHIRIIDPVTFEDVITTAGLQIERKFTYGFYWALWWTFFWQCSVPLEEANRHPLLASWAKTWALALEGPDGRRIQPLLNGLMPKNQVIIARKPA
ncbi:methyltransferase domain-containing protein [Caulobacter sp. S45]|uniref:methyltransferase domain-containing protein n=1 Tax=Caulobacter sp. S45 TaxID=1641861 RepID=UPI001C2DE961|nr:methyltransferase domain-containing protein [Caulobacter sp. S45]